MTDAAENAFSQWWKANLELPEEYAYNCKQAFLAGWEGGEGSGYDAGYDDGHSDGLIEGYEDGHDQGYHEGHVVGFDKGVAWARENPPEDIDNSYEDGYSEGHAVGYATAKLELFR